MQRYFPRWQRNTRGSTQGSRVPSLLESSRFDESSTEKCFSAAKSSPGCKHGCYQREEQERWRPRGPFQELQTKVFWSWGGGGLTVINESLNVGKHFISASSVFIRKGQPLAGRNVLELSLPPHVEERERDLPSV